MTTTLNERLEPAAVAIAAPAASRPSAPSGKRRTSLDGSARKTSGSTPGRPASATGRRERGDEPLDERLVAGPMQVFGPNRRVDERCADRGTVSGILPQRDHSAVQPPCDDLVSRRVATRISRFTAGKAGRSARPPARSEIIPDSGCRRPHPRRRSRGPSQVLLRRMSPRRSSRTVVEALPRPAPVRDCAAAVAWGPWTATPAPIPTR